MSHICCAGLSNRMKNWTLDLLTSCLPQLHRLYLKVGHARFSYCYIHDLGFRRKTEIMLKHNCNLDADREIEGLSALTAVMTTEILILAEVVALPCDTYNQLSSTFSNNLNTRDTFKHPYQSRSVPW